MLRAAVFTVLILAVAAGLRSVAIEGAQNFEAHALRRAEAALEALDARWATVRADGLRLELSGHAPDEESRSLALAALRSSVPLSRVADRATATQAPPERRGPVRVELHRDPGGVTLTGRFGGAGMRADFLIALGAALPGIPIHDLTGIDAALPPPDWGPEIAVVVEAVSQLPDAFVRVEPGRVLVEGVAAGADERDRLAERLAAVAGPALDLEAVLRVPRPLIAPFRFAVSRDPGGGLRAEACAARSEEEAARLLSALARHRRPTDVPTRCPVGLGGPPLPWGPAAEAGLAALAALPAGRFELRGRRAFLTGEPSVLHAEFEAALSVLAATLPPGFRLEAELREEDPRLAAARGAGGLWFSVRREGETLVLDGRVGGEPEKIALETLAAARAGLGGVRSELEERSLPDRRGFQEAALAAVEIAASPAFPARRASAGLTAAGLVFRASVPSPSDARALHDALAARMPEDIALTTEIVVDLPEAVAALPLSPGRCLHLLNEIVALRPVGFDVGAARISGESLATVDELAEVLSRCPGARLEIGGHTDNQGRAEFNEALSQSRAEAVRRALLDRLGPGMAIELTARGYGEDRPIAPNDTEEGRARNRRIAFSDAEG